jgi:PTH1 family peptidyl-tRNA hydrolase
MRLIVGLGNPGLRYARTRHNVGFDAVDLIAARLGWRFDAQRGKALLASGSIGTEKVLLAKPQTYMNDSGVAVGDLVRFYKLDPATDLLVICDDLDLPLAKLRLRANGKAGGQHGLESVIAHLGHGNFARIKVGVGRPVHGRDANVDFLLSQARGDERIALDAAIERAADAALCWVTDGVEVAMNRFNADGGKKKKEATEDTENAEVREGNNEGVAESRRLDV